MLVFAALSVQVIFQALVPSTANVTEKLVGVLLADSIFEPFTLPFIVKLQTITVSKLSIAVKLKLTRLDVKTVLFAGAVRFMEG